MPSFFSKAVLSSDSKENLFLFAFLSIPSSDFLFLFPPASLLPDSPISAALGRWAVAGPLGGALPLNSAVHRGKVTRQSACTQFC